MTDRGVTFALKVLMVVVLALYVAQFVLGFLAQIRTVVYIVIGAIFLAYLIYPAIHRLRKRMPLVVAILVVYAGIAAVLSGLGWFVIPRLTADVGSFVQHYPQFAARVDDFANNPNNPVSSRLPPWVRVEIARIPGEVQAVIKTRGLEGFGHVMAVLAGGFAVVATFVIMPLLTAYLLLDLDNLKSGLASVVPPERWRAALSFLAQADAVVGGFIRGQLLVALSVGVLITLALLILHVPYAFLFGLLAVIGDIVPYVGPVLAFLPAFAVAWVSNGIANALFAALAFLIVFQAEGHLLAPNIVSKTVSLSPFVVMLALLIGGELGGIFGLLIAIPVTGILRIIAVRVFRPQLANGRTP